MGDSPNFNEIFKETGTDESIKLYPFRLIFNLLMDERLENKLYAYELSYLIVFVNIYLIYNIPSNKCIIIYL